MARTSSALRRGRSSTAKRAPNTPSLLFGSALFFFSLGPLMVLAGWKGWLALLVGVWAYYHVVKQHYGFMVLYKVKNGDLARFDNNLDKLFLAVMMIFPPFRRFFLESPQELGLHFHPLRSWSARAGPSSSPSRQCIWRGRSCAIRTACGRMRRSCCSWRA